MSLESCSVRAPTWVGTLMQALLRFVLSVSTKARNPSESLIWNLKFVTELLPTARSNLAGSIELVGVHAAAAEDGVLGELHHLLGDHAPRRLELPPLAVLELHEARHEGAAGEAVGSVPPDPGAQHVPQELEACRPPPLLRACRGRARASRRATGRRRGEGEALRHVRRARAVQPLPDLHARGGSPVQVVVHLRKKKS